jgi:hypothetical protein
MDPAFPDIVGEYASEQIDDRARVWIVERGADGRLEERLDPSFLEAFDEAEEVDEFVEALVLAAAQNDIAQSRIW